MLMAIRTCIFKKTGTNPNIWIHLQLWRPGNQICPAWWNHEGKSLVQNKVSFKVLKHFVVPRKFSKLYFICWYIKHSGMGCCSTGSREAKQRQPHQLWNPLPERQSCIDWKSGDWRCLTVHWRQSTPKIMVNTQFWSLLLVEHKI